MRDAPRASDAPGILYFDPNPTTAALALAPLRRAGYEVFTASDEAQAVEACQGAHAAGRGVLRLLLIDTAISPKRSAAVLKALAALPGTGHLPVVLLTSRSNPAPIPGAEELPTVTRPFSTEILLRVVAEALDEHRAVASGEASSSEISSGALQGELSGTRLFTIASLLDEEKARGLLTFEHGEQRARLHLEHGQVTAVLAEGIDEDLRLGRFVVQTGAMNGELLERAATTAADAQQPLGAFLLAQQLVGAAGLRSAVAEQAVAVCARVASWANGRFTFAPAEPSASRADADALAFAVPLGEVILRTLRHLDEGARLPPEMSTLDEIYVRDDGAVVRLGRYAFSREELMVLERLNGRTSIKEIARQTRLGTLQIALILERLGRSKVVQRKAPPIAR